MLMKLFYIATFYRIFVFGHTTDKGDDIQRSNEDNYNLGLAPTESAMIKKEDKEYEAEKKLGDIADLFGTNQHHSYPETYKDLGRRFVPQYPYKEISNIDAGEETNFDNIAKVSRSKNEPESHLIPVKASPELVLAVAARSALLEADNPSNSLEDKYNYKKLLRSGNYWNDVWQEDVEPSILRSQEKKVIQPITVKIMPESNLYNLVSELKKISPRLVYVINKK